MEDIHNAQTLDFPTIDDNNDEGIEMFDQTITPMMLHKRGAIAPSKIMDSLIMLKDDKVVPTELVIEKMLLFNHKDEDDVDVWNMLDNDF